MMTVRECEKLSYEDVRKLAAEKLGTHSSDEILKWLRANVPPEKEFQRVMLAKLHQHFGESAFIWKQAQGPYSRGGIPDIAVVWKGKYFGFEVKRPFLGQPSKLQLRTRKKIIAAGGVAEFVSYASECIRIMEEHGE